jgi:NAD-dependent SIR2 family protein deacetylase
VDSSYLIKEKPKDIGQYKEWLKNALEIEITNKASMHYDLISNKIKYKFEESPFWMDLTNNIKNFDEEYQKEHESYKLFHDPSRPKIYTKPFDTFFLKTGSSPFHVGKLNLSFPVLR